MIFQYYVNFYTLSILIYNIVNTKYVYVCKSVISSVDIWIIYSIIIGTTRNIYKRNTFFFWTQNSLKKMKTIRMVV